MVKWPKTPASHAGNGSSNLPRVTIIGVNDDEDPPVPIPNTEVKLIRVENTWREAARKDRSTPIQNILDNIICIVEDRYSSLAQSVEHAAVNRRVVGSSPTVGAKRRPIYQMGCHIRAFSSVG